MQEITPSVFKKGQYCSPQLPSASPKRGLSHDSSPGRKWAWCTKGGSALLYKPRDEIQESLSAHEKKKSSLQRWLSTVAYSQVLNLQHLVTVVWRLEQTHWGPPSLSTARETTLCLCPGLFMLAALTNCSPVDYFSSICSPGCFCSRRKEPGCKYASLQLSLSMCFTAYLEICAGTNCIPPSLSACIAGREELQATAKATLIKLYCDLLTYHIGNNIHDVS